MKKIDKLAMCVISLALVACGGGGLPTGQNDPDSSGNQTLSKLAGATIAESGGLVGEEFSIELENAGDNTFASLSSKPIGSASVLTTAIPGLRFTFIPDVEGAYAVTLTQGSETRVIQFTVRKNFSFDIADLIPGTGATATTGLLASQFVFHSSFDRATVEREFSEIYKNLVLVGIGGPIVYIEVNRDSDLAVADFEKLKLSSGYEFFGNRRINDAVEAHYIPDDGSRFDDGGDNWHLEAIEMPSVWDVTRGSVDVSIGVADAFFTPRHEEFSLDRVISRQVPKASSDESAGTSHANAVVSTIVGNANNRKGVSGINHRSRMSFVSNVDGAPDASDLYRAACRNVNGVNRVANHSWGMVRESLQNLRTGTGSATVKP